jgi:hypothetical protein
MFGTPGLMNTCLALLYHGTKPQGLRNLRASGAPHGFRLRRAAVQAYQVWSGPVFKLLRLPLLEAMPPIPPPHTPSPPSPPPPTLPSGAEHTEAVKPCSDLVAAPNRYQHRASSLSCCFRRRRPRQWLHRGVLPPEEVTRRRSSTIPVYIGVRASPAQPHQHQNKNCTPKNT